MATSKGLGGGSVFHARADRKAPPVRRSAARLHRATAASASMPIRTPFSANGAASTAAMAAARPSGIPGKHDAAPSRAHCLSARIRSSHSHRRCARLRRLVSGSSRACFLRQLHMLPDGIAQAAHDARHGPEPLRQRRPGGILPRPAPRPPRRPHTRPPPNAARCRPLPTPARAQPAVSGHTTPSKPRSPAMAASSGVADFQQNAPRLRARQLQQLLGALARRCRHDHAIGLRRRRCPMASSLTPNRPVRRCPAAGGAPAHSR